MESRHPSTPLILRLGAKVGLIVLISLSLFGLVFGSFNLAQFSDRVDIQFQADRQTVTVGDPIRLFLTVTHPAEITVSPQKIDETWGEFDVYQQTPPETSSLPNTDLVQTTQEIEVALFNVGNFRTPSLRLNIQDADGSMRERVVPQVDITVESVLPPENPTLQDLNPQVDMPEPRLWPWILLALLGLAVALGLLTWAYYRYVFNPEPEPEPAPPPVFVDLRPPEVIALEELQRLENLDLPGQGRLKEHYSLVTDCLRLYLEGRYDLPALDLTTSETKAALNELPDLPPEAAKDLKTLLAEADLVKFARFMPEEEEARQLIARARWLVETTRAEPLDAVDAPDASDPINEEAPPPAESTPKRSEGEE